MNKDELAKKEYVDGAMKAGRLLLESNEYYGATELARLMKVSIPRAASYIKFLVDNSQFEVDIKLKPNRRRAIRVLKEKKVKYTKEQLWQLALGRKPPKAA